MFTPLRPSFLGISSPTDNDSPSVILTVEPSRTSVPVLRDGFTIGSSPQCDLILADSLIPALHSLIHVQSGAVWIEVAGDNEAFFVNDRPYRRMALRHEDCIKIGNLEFSVRIQTQAQTMVEKAQTLVSEDLSLLTAEELCDRILSEQAMVAEFAEAQRSGWTALRRAIHDAKEETDQEQATAKPHIGLDHEQAAFEALLEQIQNLNEAIVDRTRELNQHEHEVISSTTALNETQNQVSHRIDEILDQLNQTDPPNELRASA